MKHTKLAVAITLVGTLLVAVSMTGCGGGGVPVPVDFGPIGAGLTFIGLGIVFSAIISLFTGPKN